MPAPTDLAIPDDLRALTPEWVTEALRARGYLTSGRVSAIELKTVGKGLMGAIARLTLSFEGDRGTAPSTLIAKLPTEVQENRVFGEISGMYWREILFYEQLRDEVPLRIPCLYYASMSVKVPPGERIRRVAKLADWFPQRVLEKFLALRKKTAVKKRPRYMLLMEDMSPSRAGDLRRDGSLATCERVLSQIGTLHA